MYENEKWADAPGYEGLYQVSDYGRVVRCKQILPSLTAQGVRVHLRLLKPISRYAGRLSVALCQADIPKWHQVHRLVLQAFVGPCPEGMECRHLDGNHLNNRLGNLEWNTHSVNMQDKKVHGTDYTCKGEASKKSKLTEDDVRAIRAAKGTQREIAAQYGVSQVAVNHIRTRKTWKHVA